MDIYSQLKGDHDELKQLMERICARGTGAAKKREAAFRDFKMSLLVHSKVEEAVFYSQLKYIPGLEVKELEAENEHRVAGLLLEELGTMPADGPEWTAKFMMLREMLEHHIEEEEKELFKKAKQALSDDLAEDLGNRMRNRSLVVKAALEPIPAQ
jgi:hypothetical protein